MCYMSYMDLNLHTSQEMETSVWFVRVGNYGSHKELYYVTKHNPIFLIAESDYFFDNSL